MTNLPNTLSPAIRAVSFARHATSALPVRVEFHTCAVLATLVLVTGFLFIRPAHAAGDSAAGKTAFETQCAACHTTTVGKNGFGPSLAQVIGRKAGGLAGFGYSPAMAQAGLTWDEKTLDNFITSSSAAVPGTAMSVMVGNATDRANIIAYLDTLGRAAPEAAAASAQAAAAQIVLGKGPTHQELLRAGQDTQNWLYATKDYTGQRFVNLRQITPKNARQLRAVCIARSEKTGSTQTNPLVYQGVMYVTRDNATAAIDATTCHERWTYIWKDTGQVLSPANRGVAIKDGRLVRGTSDGNLIALDLDRGRLLWSQKIADAKTGQYLSMPPLIYDDLVIYGPAGADWGAKNWIGAFDLATGKQVWKFNLIPDDNEPGADSWKDADSRAHGGGSVWTPVSLDAKSGTLFVPVGNPAPDFYKEARPGDNLYTNSLVALDVKTGKLLWYKQFGPGDQYDRDLSQVSPLMSATVKGKRRNLVTVTGKDGILRMVDRDTHDVLYQSPITTLKEGGPSVAGTQGCPGLLGGMEWNGPAYSPDDEYALRRGRRLVRHVRQGRESAPVDPVRPPLRRQGQP
jgi:alcohol dehydrogenase (cytochrome c)